MAQRKDDSAGDDGVMEYLPSMSAKLIEHRTIKYHEAPLPVPGKWPNKKVDDGTDDDTVLNMAQREKKK